MDPVSHRRRIDHARERVRVQIGRGRARIRGLHRQFWHGLITGVALCIVLVVLILILKAPS